MKVRQKKYRTEISSILKFILLGFCTLFELVFNLDKLVEKKTRIFPLRQLTTYYKHACPPHLSITLRKRPVSSSPITQAVFVAIFHYHLIDECAKVCRNVGVAQVEALQRFVLLDPFHQAGPHRWTELVRGQVQEFYTLVETQHHQQILFDFLVDRTAAEVQSRGKLKKLFQNAFLRFLNSNRSTNSFNGR